MIPQIKAELLKIRSTRTTIGIVLGMIAIVLLFSILSGLLTHASDLSSPEDQRGQLGVGSLAGVFAALAGIMLITSEYRHGTIRPTFLFTPRRDIDAMGVQPAGEMAEERTIQRLPVAAVNEDHDRARAVAGKEIDPVALARAVGDHAPAGATRLAIGCGVAGPAGHDHGIFRHPRAIIVFDLVVHIRVQRITLSGQFARLRRPRLRGSLRRGLGLGQQPHQFADVFRREIGKDVGDP